MIRVIVILLILTQPLKAGCQYSATADVINDKLVNKKESMFVRKISLSSFSSGQQMNGQELPL